MIKQQDNSFCYEESNIIGKNSITFRKEASGYFKILVWGDTGKLVSSFYMDFDEFCQFKNFLTT